MPAATTNPDPALASRSRNSVGESADRLDRSNSPLSLPKRLLDKASITSNGGNTEARFVIGGRDVAYTLQTGSAANPFLLPALSGFSCPKAF